MYMKLILTKDEESKQYILQILKYLKYYSDTVKSNLMIDKL